MAIYMLIFFAALAIAYVGTPVAQRVALASGFVKQPGARHIHASPIPLLGGAAIYLAFVARPAALSSIAPARRNTRSWPPFWSAADGRGALRPVG